MHPNLFPSLPLNDQENIRMGVKRTGAVPASTESAIDMPERSRSFGRWDQIEEKHHKPKSVSTS